MSLAAARLRQREGGLDRFSSSKNPVQGVKSSLVLASATRFRDRGQKTEKLWWLVPCQGQAEGLPCRSLQRWFLLRFTRLMQTFFLFTFLKLMVKIGHSRKHLFFFFLQLVRRYFCIPKLAEFSKSS